MAEGEEVHKQAQETLARVEEEVVVTDVPQAEKAAATTVEKVPPPVPETEEPTKPKPIKEEPEEGAADAEVSKSGDNINDLSGSFKEESTRVSDLPETEKKALEELKQLIQEALNKHEFTTLPSPPPPPPPPPKEDQEKPEALEEKDKNPVEEKPSQVVADDETANPESETAAEPEKIAEPAKEGETVEVTETVVVTEVIEEKVAAEVVDDDGAKTVEAIKETIVSVSSLVPQEPTPTTSEATKEAEEKAAPSLEAEAVEKDAKVETLASLLAEEVSIWGVPLLADERSDVILLKFLRARDFKVKDAFTMIKNTVRWRKEFGIDELVEQELGSDLEKVAFMHGFDKEGHPVCYNVYGEFQNKELYQNAFSDEEKRLRFLRWRIQFLERSIRKLDFKPGGISTLVQVNDLKSSPGPNKWELRQATKQALQLLQDNYPEFVAKQVCIFFSFLKLLFVTFLVVSYVVLILGLTVF